MTGAAATEGHPRGVAISERNDGVATILSVGGNVDMAAAPALAEQVGTVLRRRPAVFVIDLSDVNFLTTAGMSILMQAQYRCQELDVVLRVVASGPMTARPMQLLGIDDLLDMYPTLDDALQVRAD